MNTYAETDMEEAQKIMITGMGDDLGIDLDYDAAWAGISNLEIVHEYIDAGAKVGVIVYTPAIGVLQTQYAKWIFILYK